MKRPWLYPGEGSRIVRMTKETLDYARYINYQSDKDTSVEPFFKITNHILKSDYGGLDQQVSNMNLIYRRVSQLKLLLYNI